MIEDSYMEQEFSRFTPKKSSVVKVKRLGTVGILRLTEGMDENKKSELIKYISNLEKSEDYLAEKIEWFYNSVTNTH
jgi:hypothetical protein